MENRDKTISNQIMVYEVRDLQIIDPEKISDSVKQKLEHALANISKKEIGLRALFTLKDMKEKDELDKIIFCDILGMKIQEMKKIKLSLGKIVRERVERGNLTEQ